jgi:methylglutamate dehydrogenase subunit D
MEHVYMANSTTMAPLSSFAGLPVVSSEGRGVLFTDRDGLGIATVLGHKGEEALASRLRDRFDLDLPRGPRRVGAGGLAFAGIGPGTWLATAENSGNAFAATLRHALGDLASISDQSDGYAVLRLTGPKVRATLAKGVSVDLHDRSFRPGDVASSVVSHIGATLWRIEDSADGSPAFEFAVFRSLAGSFWDWLSESAAEYGLVVMQPGRG